MAQKILFTLNILAAFMVFITLALIWKGRKNIRGIFSIMMFLACVFLYLIIDEIPSGTIKFSLLVGPWLLPFSFWLFTRSLFNDHELLPKNLFIYSLLSLSSYLLLYYLKEVSGYNTYPSLIGRIFSIFFVIMALYESQKGQTADLDINRLKLRRYFIYLVGCIVLITLIVEIGLLEANQRYPRLLQRFIILLLSFLFVYYNFSLKSKILIKPKKKSTFKYPELMKKIQLLMIESQLYQQEKLTIGQLAEQLNEQEYLIRKVINQDMGYRNFLDFVNSYRIKEATTYLIDPSQRKMTVLEIAYKTGFNSIGPFNRSFKQAIGMTPTDYRKKHLK